MRDIEVITAASAAEAFGRLRSVRFMVDTAITDLNLERGSGELEGAEVAGAISDNSGGAIPVFAYSGKETALDKTRRRYYRKVVFKSASPSATRQLLTDAAVAARRFFEGRASRAIGLIERVEHGPELLTPDEVGLLRDLIAGSSMSLEYPARRQMLVGVLTLDNGTRIPYALEGPTEVGSGGPIMLASALGHEYLYGIGLTGQQASASLADVLHAYMYLVPTVQTEAVGVSLEMRVYMEEIMRAGDAVDDADG